ncbi:MAG: DUF4384 domain-containing protein [SAR324 cluster bacterium]|nr:DUF4384 domain-containing protein [SAR324 cluster bacterium]
MLIKKLFYISIICLFSGCASSPIQTANNQEPKQKLVEKREEKIRTIPEKMPNWVGKGRSNDNDYLYFEGVSIKFSEEKTAWDQAFVHATNQFVKYCGVDVQLIDEYLEIIDQSSSETIDPQIRAKRRELHRAEAFVRRIKVDGRFVEEYVRYEGEILVGRSFKARVLIQVPLNEYNRVQEFKLKQEEEKRLAVEKQRSEKIKKLQNLFQKAEILLREGKIAFALNALNRIKAILKSGFSPEEFSIDKIEIREKEIISNIEWKADTALMQSLEVGESPTSVTSQIIYQHQDQTHPVVDLPILVHTEFGKKRLMPDRQGAIQYHHPAPFNKEGVYQINLTIDSSLLSDQISAEALEHLNQKHLSFAIAVTPPSIEKKARELVTQMAAQWTERYEEKPVNVILGNFTFEESGMANVFIQRFIDLIASELDQSSLFVRKASTALNRSRMRGSSPQKVSPYALAQLSEKEAYLLTGNYIEEENYVRVSSSLKNNHEQVLAGATVKIRRQSIPKNWPLEPSNLHKLRKLEKMLQSARKDNDFELELWLNKGNGALYQEGEELVIGLRSQNNCFLQLFYTDSAYQVKRIFPNQYAVRPEINKGETYILPSEEADYDFKVSCGNVGDSCGVEKLIAFCSTAPLKELPGDEIGYGILSLQETPDHLLDSLMHQAKSNQEIKRSVESATLTSIPKTERSDF